MKTINIQCCGVMRGVKGDGPPFTCIMDTDSQYTTMKGVQNTLESVVVKLIVMSAVK